MRVDQSTVFRWIKDGDIRSFKIGGRRYIPVSEVERLLGGGPSS
jgi:excisionase family DNA binding protein